MFKKVILVFISFFMASAFAQENMSKKMTYDNLGLQIEYIDNKKTFVIEKTKDDTVKDEYKMLLRDIHPEGIFLTKNKKSKISIRILSINNGHLFIESEFKNGFRVSNSTNFIDIGPWNKKKEKELQDVINRLKKMIKSKASKKKNKSEDIDIIIPSNG